MEIFEVFRRDDPQNYTSASSYRSQCTLDTCPLSKSFFAYRPSLAANATFLALFACSLAAFLAQGVTSRKFIGFTAAMVSGCVLEVLGYVGRIMSYQNPFNEVSVLTKYYLTAAESP